MNDLCLSTGDIRLLKSFRGFSGTRNKRAEGLFFIFTKLKGSPSSKITAEMLSEAIGITERGALKMLQWFASQGFLSSTKYRFDIPVHLQCFGLTHKLHRNFYGVMDALREFFYKIFGKVSSATIIEEYSKKYSNTELGTSGRVKKSPMGDENARREQYRAWIEAGRTDLWEEDCKRYAQERQNQLRRRAVELLKAKGLSDAEARERANTAFPVESSHVNESEDTHTNVGTYSILHFMGIPRLSDIQGELDEVEGVLDDLKERRDEWTEKQRRLWYCLVGKRKKLFGGLKELLHQLFGNRAVRLA